MRTLDKSRPFGEICGTMGSYPRARFEQDGLLFDCNGMCLSGPENPKQGPIELYKSGMSVKDIARITKLHHKTVEKMIKDADSKADGAMG